MFVLKVILVLFVVAYMYCGSVLWEELSQHELFLQMSPIGKAFWYVVTPLLAMVLFVVYRVNPYTVERALSRMKNANDNERGSSHDGDWDD